jgi:hypothetical protein
LRWKMGVSGWMRVEEIDVETSAMSIEELVG